MSALAGWAIWIEGAVGNLLAQLERCADALERIADASEEPEPDEEEDE
jgi:hypothetical protein